MKTDNTIEIKSKNPIVVLALNQYRSLMDRIEEMEDRLAIRERKNDKEVPWEEVDKKIKKKFGLK